MQRIFIITLMLLLPLLIVAQDKTDTKKKTSTSVEFPTQMSETDAFTVKHVSFNKKIDPRGQGELLQIDFQVVNNVDVELNLYIFVIATNEELEWKMNSFGNKKTTPKGIMTNYIKSTPSDITLFEYERDGKKEIIKHPKNIKAGTDPRTGKAYKLSSSIAYRTELLTHYRRKFLYFNSVTLLIFDINEKLLFRQFYTLDGTRR